MPIIVSLIFGWLKGFISAAFTFLTTKPGVYILIAGIVVGTGWYLHHSGYSSGVSDQATKDKLAHDAEVVAAYKAGTLIQAKQDKVTHDADVAYAVNHPKIVTVTQTIIKEVPAHVTPQIDAAFPVPCGAVRVFDAAALSADIDALPYPTGLNDAAACPIKASVLASAGASAIRAYIELSDQLVALQDWVTAQQAANP